jgi:hypothetical protein
MNLDHPDLADDRAAFEARLNDLGPDTVRTMLAAGMFPTGHNVTIQEWLGSQGKPKKATKNV